MLNRNLKIFVVCLSLILALLDCTLGQQIPISLNDKFRRAVISISSAASLFGIHSGLRFIEDEKRVISFKDALKKYIQPGMSCLEVGFGADGDGTNLKYYPNGFALTAIDPLIDKGSGGKRRRQGIFNYSMKGIQINYVNAQCESLPFPTESFDAVICTLVLCSVRSPKDSVKEILRVLRPGGIFICQEHLHGKPQSILAFQQDLFDPLQQSLANNCHLTRETDILLDNFEEEGYKFSKTLEREVVMLSSHWPISRQLLAVYQK